MIRGVLTELKKGPSTEQVLFIIKAMKSQMRGRQYCPEEAWEQQLHRPHSRDQAALMVQVSDGKMNIWLCSCLVLT